MKRRGVNVLLSQELRQELNIRDLPSFPDGADARPENEPIDFAVSVGGDGTFLTTASIIGDRNIPILGINCGHLGFLADVQTKDVDLILTQLLDGQYTIEQARCSKSVAGKRI
ncbi:MAG: NAD(+)/NADH kinase [Paludibacteraceae bacterium]|nr:NAD(+)/NADH kinase [Paludibacteraceae bacterium]